MEVTADKVFEVNAPVDQVWSLLSDPARVVVCVPGAQLTEIVDDQNFKGKISVKIGPVTSKFNGDAKFEKLDAEAKEMVLYGTGADTGGKGSANMTMTVKLSTKGDGTEVSSSMKLSITGKLAQFGSRMIVAVNDKIFEQFAQSFKKTVESGGEEEAAPAAEPAPAAPAEPAPAAATSAAASESTASASASASAPSVDFGGLESRVATLEAAVRRMESQVRVLQSQLNAAEEPEPVNGLKLVGSAILGMFSGKK
jgi:carbon monoxide dehydrogenase subunit G